ncbi:MAG TPA: aminoglycoside phosphotransferase family protein [Pseudonocardiaceae bacterium]|nr:aminoglycoside phosphotransferase family protein [Pseudonocardiaceae bacterium]
MSTQFGIGGTRIGWADVPEHVRSALAARLGADIVAEVSQPGGFSPGLAARLRLADGRRVFVKAVGTERNPESPEMHRREIEILRALPRELPVPALLDSYDDGDWVALVIEDVEGSSPALPWRTEEFAEVVRALSALTAQLTPSPIETEPIEKVHPELFGNWSSFAGDPVGAERLPDWAADHLDLLVELESAAVDAARGDTLLHADLRADNLLRTERGIVFVDWPHACLGAGWVDLLALLPSVGMQGGPDLETVWQQAIGSAADPDAVNAVLAAFAGFLLIGSLRPAPPNLPGLRTFQRPQGDAALGWLRARCGD